ncbi:MAG TPA: hypothetical protein VIV58_12475, partial [Kofleriaceae bacterium]
MREVFNRSSPVATEWARAYAAILEHRDPSAIRAFLRTESAVAKHLFLRLYVAGDAPDPALLFLPEEE